MNEIWKDIEGYEGLYKISNTGKIKSLNYGGKGYEKLMSPSKNKDGYLIIKLYKNGSYITKTLHRLVAEQFIEKPKLEVNHLNGDRTNNSIENLEWCTHPENERYSWKRLGKIGKGGYKKKSLEKAVIQYDLKDNYIKRWKSASEAGRKLGIRISKISDCCRKKRNKTGGYKWKFADR